MDDRYVGTLHLFSRNAKNYSISSTSSLEETVSAYTTVSETADSMTVIIVNRDMSSSRNVTVNLNNISVANGSYTTLQLASLPSTETFKSHTDNALKANSVTVNANSLTISAPKLSVTAILLKSATATGIDKFKTPVDDIKIYPNPVSDDLNIRIPSNVAEPTQVVIFDQRGRQIKAFGVNYDGCSPINLNLSSLPVGFYLLSVKNNHCFRTKEFTIIR
jgi:hypothetical protein